jgi:hypothetical protein
MPVEVFGVIALVVGFVASVLSIAGYSARDAFRKIRTSRAEVPAVEPEPAPAVKQEPVRPLPVVPRAPRWIMRPGYRYTGGAVSTGAVMDLDGYMESMTSRPAGDTWLQARGTPFPFGPPASTAGTATTA